jgi:hypothetical protein
MINMIRSGPTHAQTKKSEKMRGGEQEEHPIKGMLQIRGEKIN